MYVYRYKIKVILLNDKESAVCGIIFARNYKEAVEQLIYYYGEDPVQDILCLRAIGNEAVIEMPHEFESMIDKIEDEWIW